MMVVLIVKRWSSKSSAMGISTKVEISCYARMRAASEIEQVEVLGINPTVRTHRIEKFKKHLFL